MPHGPARMEMRRGPGAMAHDAPHRQVRERIVVRRGGEGMMRHPSRTRFYRDYRRMDRGAMLPHSWWGPRFHIMNWGAYGLPQPMHGGRWVRYYDDALMVDGHGRIHDGRWGMEWDERDESWSYDERGVPFYVGERGHHPRGGDRVWGEHRGYGPGMGYGPPPPPVYGHRGYGHPGYGHPVYGYAYGGGMVITETTTTTSPTVITETHYVDEEVRSAPRAKAKSRRVRSKTRCIC
jgi:Ni/Co efflux regulator RcnB